MEDRPGFFGASGRNQRGLIENLAKSHMLLQDLANRCDAVEECYEFMLAYAAQGLARDSGSGSGEKLRGLLGRALSSLAGLSEAYKTAITAAGLQPANRHEAFLAVLDRDCKDSIAAMELVLSQPVISSQLIDNLNASIHLRALLTDLFLLDEIAKLHRLAADQDKDPGGRSKDQNKDQNTDQSNDQAISAEP
jgi:hypothetical protein